MLTSSGGLSLGLVGGESGAAVAAVAAGSTAAVDFLEMAACQRSCPEMAAAKDSLLKLQLLHVGNSRLLCDVSAGRVRPVVPAALRRRVFNQLHSIAHPGVRATRRLIAARIVWPAMAADVAVWCRDCVACNRAKITRHAQAPVQQMEVPRSGSHTYTWISWGHSRSPRRGSATCSQWWTGPPGGRRPFLYMPLQQRTAWRPSSAGGWPASACQPTSRRTGAFSSLQVCGQASVRG